MLIVGLTGGIGSGKTSLAEALARRGAVVLDVDGLGRQVIGHGGSAVEAVVERFGPQVRHPEGGVDRAALAEIVFHDEQALSDLTDISHPRINQLLDEAVERISDDSIVVYDMAVLAESELGWSNRHPYEIVITVEAPPEVRFERLRRRGVSPEDARARMESQASDEERRAVADYVVANQGDLEDLDHVAGEVWSELQRLHDQKRRPLE